MSIQQIRNGTRQILVHFHPRDHLLAVAGKRDLIGAAHHHGGKSERSPDVFAGELRPSLNDLFRSIALGDAADDHADWSPRSLDARLSVMDRGVDRDPVTPAHG